MAADEARATRIRDLYERNKADDPRFTWRRIAEHVGVSERAAIEWGKTGGIDYENVPKLAELFGVDPDFVWRGDQPDTPDLSRTNGQPAQLDRIEAMLLAVLERLDMDPDEALREQLLKLGRFAAREELAAADAPASVPARTGRGHRASR